MNGLNIDLPLTYPNLDRILWTFHLFKVLWPNISYKSDIFYVEYKRIACQIVKYEKKMKNLLSYDHEYCTSIKQIELLLITINKPLLIFIKTKQALQDIYLSTVKHHIIIIERSKRWRREVALNVNKKLEGNPWYAQRTRKLLTVNRENWAKLNFTYTM